MAIRPNNEERSFGADRERQREISNEGGRAARSTSEGASSEVGALQMDDRGPADVRPDKLRGSADALSVDQEMSDAGHNAVSTCWAP